MAQICQRCHGNGYIKVKESIENPTETILQCPLCNSQGEIMDKNTFEQERQRHRIKTERLMLESVLVKELNVIIKKQNDEIDMLLKQKQFLQSKLREATGGKDQTSSKQGN
jgi:RecJ-like exonuclease